MLQFTTTKKGRRVTVEELVEELRLYPPKATVDVRCCINDVERDQNIDGVVDVTQLGSGDGWVTLGTVDSR